MEKLFKNTDDFLVSLQKGIDICGQDIDGPQQEDAEDLKSLLAVFITATVKMDPESISDAINGSPKLSSVRQALLAAYNLGRNSRLEKG